MTSIRKRIPRDERKKMIARAAAELFAKHGFHASGSRDIASASGVSEALMFRYFPSKDALWAAALESCRENAVADTLRTIPGRPPSAAALVELSVQLARGFIESDPPESAHNRDVLNRMMLRSMAEDGEFARLVRQDLSPVLARYVSQCITAGRETGEIILPSDEPLMLLGLSYLGPFFFVGLHRLASVAPLSRTRVVELENMIARAQLRSIGMRADVIEREMAVSTQAARRTEDELTDEPYDTL